MGTGTCAVLWQTKRNVVSTQVQDRKGRRGDLPLCSLSFEGTDSGPTSPQRGVRLTPMGWQKTASTNLSQHQQQQQNMLSTTERGREKLGSLLGGPKLVMGKVGAFVMSGHTLSPDPLHTPNSHTLSMDPGRPFPLLWRREQEGLAWGKNGQLQPVEENLANSKKWLHE